ncbi:MAG: adenylate/guanylate cyclase domain-containing protein [Frankiaceae bacterium]|nr:adenylate/guanylate cyclase domain-containing protein [Frankiaceae bacterium]
MDERGQVTAWELAGLYDPAAHDAADRLALLQYLEAQGCDLEEMVDAEARDRLFALAGDRILRPSRPRYDCEQAASVLGTDAATVSRAWRSFGLPAPVEPVLGEQDLQALRTWLLVKDLLGADAATALARVLGSGIARLAEAASATMRGDTGGVGQSMDRARSGSEAVTARAFADASTLVPLIGNVLDAVHRHHLEAARRHFELVAPTPDSVRCGVGFADLTGFTSMSQAIPMRELSGLLSAFEEASSDTVQDAGGRVVKFLGDAVMFVAPTASATAEIACALVNHPKAAHAGLGVRAGIAYGDLLAQDGDYFGPPVNLASRLVAIAEPGEVLASPAVVPLLDPTHTAEEREPQTLRGIAEPVTPYAVVSA